MSTGRAPDSDAELPGQTTSTVIADASGGTTPPTTPPTAGDAVVIDVRPTVNRAPRVLMTRVMRAPRAPMPGAMPEEARRGAPLHPLGSGGSRSGGGGAADASASAPAANDTGHVSDSCDGLRAAPRAAPTALNLLEWLGLGWVSRLATSRYSVVESSEGRAGVPAAEAWPAYEQNYDLEVGYPGIRVDAGSSRSYDDDDDDDDDDDFEDAEEGDAVDEEAVEVALRPRAASTTGETAEETTDGREVGSTDPEAKATDDAIAAVDDAIEAEAKEKKDGEDFNDDILAELPWFLRPFLPSELELKRQQEMYEYRRYHGGFSAYSAYNNSCNSFNPYCGGYGSRW